MIVGIPKEIKDQEYRVSLLPENVKEICSHGHTVFVQCSAGKGSGFFDAEYEAAGATLLHTIEEVYAKSEMIVKVKEPQPSEYPLLRENQILFTYLHLAPLPELTKVLVQKRVIAIAYETIEVDGTLPLLRPMSEIAGEIAPLMASYHLSSFNKGEGLLMCGATGVKGANVLILGNGTVSLSAAKIAKGIGANVTILARNPKHAEQQLNQVNLLAHLKESDVVIGGILVKGDKAPHLITRTMLKEMKKGSIIVDVAIDQGGCVETSHATTHADPTYEVDGIIHYCVANMPGAYPKTSSIALSNASREYVMLLCDLGYREALKHSKALRYGVNTYLGHVTYKAVAEAHALEYIKPEDLIS